MKRVTLLTTFLIPDDGIDTLIEEVTSITGFERVNRNSAYPHIVDIPDTPIPVSEELDAPIPAPDPEEHEMDEENLKPEDYPDGHAYQDFIRAMNGIGVQCRLHHGKYFYVGPAVVTRVEEGLSESDILKAAYAADLEVRSDPFGQYDKIIYPD